jgi:hypothetical protein
VSFKVAPATSERARMLAVWRPARVQQDRGLDPEATFHPEVEDSKPGLPTTAVIFDVAAAIVQKGGVVVPAPVFEQFGGPEPGVFA